jgi:hypothetical protein
LPWDALLQDEPAILGILSVFAFLFGLLLMLLIGVGQWRKAIWLFVVSVLLAVGMAAYSLRIVETPLEPGEVRTWDGWPLIWLFAVQAVVIVLLLVLLVRGSAFAVGWIAPRDADRLWLRGMRKAGRLCRHFLRHRS